MLFPVYGGFCTRILLSILVLLSCFVLTTALVFGLVLLLSTHFAPCSLLLSPKTAHCLVLSGTCYGVVEFHVFLREYVDYGS